MRNPDGHTNNKGSIGTSYVPVLSIRVRPEMNGVLNRSDVLPLFATVGIESTKPGVAELFVDATLTDPVWVYHNSSTDSVVEYDISATALNSSGAETLGAIALGKADSGSIDLSVLDARLGRAQTLTIAVKVTGGTAAEATAALVWRED
jgi:hypothetical protein